jgi:hypothetical protein
MDANRVSRGCGGEGEGFGDAVNKRRRWSSSRQRRGLRRLAVRECRQDFEQDRADGRLVSAGLVSSSPGTDGGLLMLLLLLVIVSARPRVAGFVSIAVGWRATTPQGLSGLGSELARNVA